MNYICKTKLLHTHTASTQIRKTESDGDMAVGGAVQFSSSCSLKPSAVYYSVLLCSAVK